MRTGMRKWQFFLQFAKHRLAFFNRKFLKQRLRNSIFISSIKLTLNNYFPRRNNKRINQIIIPPFMLKVYKPLENGLFGNTIEIAPIRIIQEDFYRLLYLYECLLNIRDQFQISRKPFHVFQFILGEPLCSFRFFQFQMSAFHGSPEAIHR